MLLRKALYKNFRIIYLLSRRLRFRFTPNGWLVLTVLIASGAFGIDTRQTLAFQIFSICLALLLVSSIYIYAFRGKFIITRQLPDHGCNGETLSYQCHIENRSKGACKNLLLIDELTDHFPAFSEYIQSHDPHDRHRNIYDRFIGYPRLASLIQKNRGGIIRPAHIDHIAKQEKTPASLQLIPLRRGYLYFNRIKIAQTDPLGLIRSFKTYPAHDKLIILPKLYPLPAIPFKNRRLIQHRGVNLASPVGESNEFMSLRAYRPGDPLRSIHWRSYAKRNQPIVKEYQDEYFSRSALILDTFSTHTPDPVFEEAVSIISSFLVAMERQDCLLDLLLVGEDAFHFTSGRGLAGTANMLETLACVTQCRLHPFQQLTRLVQRNITRYNSLTGVLLDFNQERKELIELIAQTNLPSLWTLIRDHHAPPDDIEKYQTPQLHIHRINLGSLQDDLAALKGITQ